MLKDKSNDNFDSGASIRREDTANMSSQMNVHTTTSKEVEDTNADFASPRRLPLKIDEMLKPTDILSSSDKSTTDMNRQTSETRAVDEKFDSTEENRPMSDEDLIAVSALGKLKRDSSMQNAPKKNNMEVSKTNNSQIKLSALTSNSSKKLSGTATTDSDKKNSGTDSNSTIFNKVIAHPFISNSINYVLEKTIHTANNNVPSESTFTEPSPEIKQNQLKRMRENDEIPDSSILFKKVKSKSAGPLSLRQQVSISSALSTQKNLKDLKHLSTLNLNIESRKKLTMLIHFLKLGNNQLSERIDNLIQSVDKKREKNGHKSSVLKSNEATSSDQNIQEIKSDIVSTVKKIVNVVSKVSAQSLSEPARSHVREALLKLPTLMNNDSFDHGLDISDDEEDDEDDEEEGEEKRNDDDDMSDTSSIASHYEDSLEHQNQSSDIENIPTMKVTSKTIFKRTKKLSIRRRLLNSLIRYRRIKTIEGGNNEEKNISKLKQWFKKKIKYQMMHDTNGKVLILAQESLDMVNKIIKFCNESLDKADNWNNDRQQRHQIELLNKLQNITTVKKNSKQEIIPTITVKDTTGSQK